MEINEDHPRGNKERLFVQSLARESATITWIWQKLKGKQCKGKLYGKKREDFGYACLEVVSMKHCVLFHLFVSMVLGWEVGEDKKKRKAAITD